MGLKPDPAAMPLDDPFADGQPDSRAGVFLTGMQTLKNNKYPVFIFFINTDAVVFYGKNPFPVPLGGRHVNMGRGFPPGI